MPAEHRSPAFDPATALFEFFDVVAALSFVGEALDVGVAQLPAGLGGPPRCISPSPPAQRTRKSIDNLLYLLGRLNW